MKHHNIITSLFFNLGTHGISESPIKTLPYPAAGIANHLGITGSWDLRPHSVISAFCEYSPVSFVDITFEYDIIIYCNKI